MKLQKRLAARVLGISKERVKVDPSKRESIKEAITKYDIRKLIRDRIITKKPIKGVSRVRARARQEQKRKGRQRGLGRRKGKASARQEGKTPWVNKIRSQRKLIKELKDKKIITGATHRVLYKKAKGGFFRSTKHIKNYINEHKLTITKGTKP